ncbi:uncharacterized protein LJ206_001744 isoform 1-T1 [Theristicus caerulescens]
MGRNSSSDCHRKIALLSKRNFLSHTEEDRYHHRYLQQSPAGHIMAASPLQVAGWSNFTFLTNFYLSGMSDEEAVTEKDIRRKQMDLNTRKEKTCCFLEILKDLGFLPEWNRKNFQSSKFPYTPPNHF